MPDDSPLLSIVIPVFNERDSLPVTLARVAAAPYDKEVIVVDDGSTDGTADFLDGLQGGREKVQGLDPSRLSIIFHRKNCGKGAALRTGFGAAHGRFIIIQDADLEYDPSDYPRLLEPLVSGRADVVYGSRLAGGGAHRVLFFWHYAANRLLTLISNMLTNLNLTDMETGYKTFRRDILERMKVSSNRFGVEPELTAKFSRLRCRIYEVPIAYHGRTYEEGKKISWRDGIAALFHTIRFRFFD
jgi:glycosyltransferase involved in cell wall biosynthesis